MSSNYKLLWLNGPLQGREFVLPTGSLSIGPDGDIIAHPDNVDELTLLIDEAGVHVSKPIPIRVDGKTETGLVDLPMGKVVELDGIAILLGKTDESLTMKTVPGAVQERHYAYISLGITGLAALILLVGLFLVALPSQTHKPVLTQSQWLSGKIKESGLDGITVSWSGSGAATLSGHCRQQHQIVDLLGQLNNHGIALIDHVQCNDQLIAMVKEILTQHGFQNVFVQADDKPGSVRISGAISSGKAWNKVVTDLNRLPGLTGWHVSSQENQQIKTLIDVLRKKQLLQGLLIRRVDKTFMLTGRISKAIQDKIRDAALIINTHNPDKFKLVFQNIPVHDELTQLLGAPISSFGGNARFPFIELEDGTRLTTGSESGNGYRISYMDRDGLDLTRSGEIIHIPLII